MVDFVRLVSILAVFAVHLAASGTVAPLADPLAAERWSNVSRNGSYGVTLFFVVSGFVITRTVRARNRDFGAIDLRGFYVRRAGRILPALGLAVAAGLVGLAFAGAGVRRDFCFRDPHARFDAGFWLAIPAFAFNWLRIARESDAYGFGLHWDILWSLAIEEQFYLGYPLLLRTLRTERRVAAALSVFVLLGPATRAAAVAWKPESFLLAFTSSFAAFEQIALGCLLCLVLERLDARRLPAVAEWGMGLAGVAGIVLTYRYTALALVRDCVWGPSAVALSLCAFLFVGIRRNWFRGPLAALCWPGQWSYGAYLFHPIALFLLWPVFGRLGVTSAFLLYAASTLALAAVLYLGWERPANAWVRRRLGRQVTLAPSLR